MTHPAGVVFDGDLDVAEDWREAAHASGRLIIMTATPLITDTPAAVARAVRDGRVIAATVALPAIAEHQREFGLVNYRRSA